MAEQDFSVRLRRAPATPLASAVPGLAFREECTICIAKLQIYGGRAEQRFSDVVGTRPPAPRTQEQSDGLTTAWLAPGEWLLIGAESTVVAKLLQIEGRGGGDVLAIEITHARTAFLLSGTNAREALAAHCPLDFQASFFPINAVARSLLGNVGMFIARLEDVSGAPCFRIIVDQTMRQYAARMFASPFRSSGDQ